MGLSVEQMLELEKQAIDCFPTNMHISQTEVEEENSNKFSICWVCGPPHYDVNEL